MVVTMRAPCDAKSPTASEDFHPVLNDLRTIERGLAAHGIVTVARHPDVKDMAKGWAFRVRLATDGSVGDVSIVAEAGRGNLWTLRDGQHNGFPGLKTAAGLLSDKKTRDAHSRLWESDKNPTNRRNELMKLINSGSVTAGEAVAWPNAGHRKRIKERLEALRPLTDDPLTAAVPAAFERFLLALDRSPSFLGALTAALAERVHSSGDEWLEPVHEALIGPVALSVDALDAVFPRSADDPRQIGAVSVALSASEVERTETDAGARCALSGKTAKLHAGNFPQPNLPGLGQTYIFSRNRDIPSLTRYGRTADASFPIDSDLVRRLSGIITALTREEAKDRTWRLIPAEKGDKPDLMITSIASDPKVRLAGAIAGDDDEDIAGQSALNELGARVIRQSRGIHEHEYSQDEVMVLILRTVDPANRKVIYHRNTSAADFFDAARLWRETTTNVPDWLGFRSPVKGQRELVFRSPPRVSPLSIIPLSRVQFANGGRRRVDVIGVTAADAFGLFLLEGNIEQRSRKVLRLLIRRHGPLLGGLTAARAKGIDHLKGFDPKTDLRRDALRYATWIGVLLHRLGRSKEAYMTDAGFRLGQFLAVADTIHIGYCNDLRSGDVPPTLIGNSVLAAAGANPVRALSVLQTRLKPYLAWAKRVDFIFAKAADVERNGNKGREIALRRGVSHARRADEIAAELHTMLAPYRAKLKVPDEAFKSELLLGYMAGLPPLKRSDDLSDQEDGNSIE